MGTHVLHAVSCITWVPMYYMCELMYCMNRWYALHNRVACNTCLTEMYCMRHCPVQHAQLTQIHCLFGSKCRHIGSSLQIPHTSGQSRGTPCKRRFLKVAPAFTAWRLQLRAHRGLQRELFAKQACVVSLLAAASPGRPYHAS